MKQKLLAEDAGERTFILVLEEGDEAFSAISAFAAQENIAGASLTRSARSAAPRSGSSGSKAKTTARFPSRNSQRS